MVKLGDEETRKLLFFQQVTSAMAKDCIDEDDRIVFVVANGELGAAVGKRGANVVTLEKLLKKKITVIEHSDDAVKFAANIFFPAKMNAVLTGDKLTVKVDENDRKYVIGKGGSKIKLARLLLKRHFNINDIKV